MTERLDNLQKIPQEPAARLLALANARLGLKLESPASAMVPEVLEELDRKGAVVDMLRMLAVALPPRERVWWACLAARDLVAAGAVESPALVEATEAWVYDPSDEKLAEVHRLIEGADPEDETVLCATSALYAGGKLGPGDLSGLDAPVGASETYALVMNARSLTQFPDRAEAQGRLLIERALDIARGGQGAVSVGA
jgi:hypothetical protein